MLFLYGCYFYLTFTALLAMRLGWHMLLELDSFDWQYSEVWPIFWTSVLLWPALMIKPTILLRLIVEPPFPRESADYQRKLYRLRKSPPPCGTQVRYAWQRDDGKSNTFVFVADTVERTLSRPDSENSRMSNEHDADILRWVKRRNIAEIALTDVPAEWCFQYLAADLIEQGYGVAYCGSCGKATRANELVKESFSVVGHGFHSWNCPCGRQLLCVDGMRIIRRRAPNIETENKAMNLK